MELKYHAESTYVKFSNCVEVHFRLIYAKMKSYVFYSKFMISFIYMAKYEYHKYIKYILMTCVLHIHSTS